MDLNKTMFEDFSDYNYEKKYTIYMNKKSQLSIRNKLWYSPNTGNHDVYFIFKNINGKLILDNYSESKTTHNVNSTPSDLGIYKEFDLTKRIIEIEDSSYAYSTREKYDKCEKQRTDKLIRKCLGVINIQKKVPLDKIPTLEISDFKTFEPINWCTLGIKSWCTPLIK